MGKYVADLALDAALAHIATCTRIDVTSDVGTPGSLANSLATKTIAAGVGNGVYTVVDGSVSGRKLVVAQQDSLPIEVTGLAKHIVLSVGGLIKLVTTCNDQQLTDGGTVTIPTFSDEIADPA